MAIDNFRTAVGGDDPEAQGLPGGRLRRESIQYHLGGTFRGTYYTLNDNIINGRIRGIGRRGGLQQRPDPHNEAHIQVVKELIKNDVIVLTTGCNGIACAMEGLLTPGIGQGLLRSRAWPKSAKPSASRRFCTWAPAWTTAASCWPPPKWSKPAVWARTSPICPQPAALPNG
jgi:lysophospholipase L1-like esterase